MTGLQEIRDRIIAVANELYSIHPGKIPKVAEVRKIARCDMNTAAEVMKIWRENLERSQVEAPVLNQAPLLLQYEISKVTEQLWKTLQAQADIQVNELTDQLNQANQKIAELQAKHLELENEHRKALRRERKLIEKLNQLQGK